MNSSDVYYVKDGELYHYGRPGMQWGKHLPGTTYWKENINAKGLPNTPENFDPSAYIKSVGGSAQRTNTSVAVADSYRNYTGRSVDKSLRRGREKYTQQALYRQNAKKNMNAGHGGRANSQIVEDGADKGQYHTLSGKAGQAARNAANSVSNAAKRAQFYATNDKARSWLWNSAKGWAKGQIEAFKKSANNAYQSLRSNVHNVFRNSRTSYFKSGGMSGKTPLSHLDKMVGTEYEEALATYRNSMTNGSVGNTMNTFIQTAQFNVVKGLNSFLKKIGLDDEVDDFISKFRGESAFGKKRRLDNLNSQMNNGNLGSKEEDLKKRRGVLV